MGLSLFTKPPQKELVQLTEYSSGIPYLPFTYGSIVRQWVEERNESPLIPLLFSLGLLGAGVATSLKPAGY